jgi:hypothetical protein
MPNVFMITLVPGLAGSGELQIRKGLANIDAASIYLPPLDTEGNAAGFAKLPIGGAGCHDFGA